jgi:hypothetical protein
MCRGPVRYEKRLKAIPKFTAVSNIAAAATNRAT